MKKEFVTYELSLELKQLGFDKPCFGVYFNSTQELFIGKKVNQYTEDVRTSAPTYSQCFRWFRDKKLSDMCVCRYQGRDDGGVYYYYSITKDFGIEETRHFKEGFFTYEEAELECLEKLIEIVKEVTNEQ